jgi:hypothetical protein
MASFWQMTARICSCREEPSDSYDFAVLCALRSVQSPLSTFSSSIDFYELIRFRGVEPIPPGIRVVAKMLVGNVTQRLGSPGTRLRIQ